MYPILLTTTTEKQPDAVVAWDPLGGTPIATLAGETAHRGSVTRFAEGVICAAAKKPFIQFWNFQSASSSYKRILTKGLVNAITLTPDSEYIFVAFEREVYMYQISSGCLIGVLSGSHSAKIGELRLVNWLTPGPAMLITADVSGFIACWDLGSLVDELSLLTSNPPSDSSTSDKEKSVSETVSHSQSPPVWYTLQASHYLPRVDVFRQLVLAAGSEGLKVYNLMDGSVVGTTLCDVSGGLHSVSVIPPNGKTFCGGCDGLLYTTQIAYPQISVITTREVRRCFVNSKLPSAEKTITELALAPFDYSLLAVGARGGMIEILRPDALLTCLHQFSVLNPTLSADLSLPYQLTGLCFVPRPDWLSGSQETTSTNDFHSNSHHSESDTLTGNKGLCDIEPFKRHFGWRLDDVVRVRLPAIQHRTDTRAEMADIYMDDFDTAGDTEVTDVDKSETRQLLEQIDKLNSLNRELFHRLMDRELQG